MYGYRTRNGRFGVAEFLLRTELVTSLPKDQYGLDPLFIAAGHSHIDTAKFLLNISEVDLKFKTVLGGA